MKYRIEKTFTFEAAHRLLTPYPAAGKCASLHGHSFAAVLRMESDALDGAGMVVDFAELGAVKEWILKNLDHATLLREDDPLLPALREAGHKTFVLSRNPTSEVLAERIGEACRAAGRWPGVSLASVRVRETCTSAADVFWTPD